MTDLGVTAQFSEKLQILFKPMRTKVLYGGRGAGRSWGVARWLLLEGVKRPIRVLCARELQKSIEESVHKVLKDQIEILGLSRYYDVQKSKIYGPNGTEFFFEGVKNNVSTVRSMEGIDYCWVEEANKVTKASWGVLIPTIRKKGSEIILTFNPELDTDYTYKQFVLLPDPDTVVVHMTWRDNPWFTEVLFKEKEKLRRSDIDAYNNVWEGRCIQNVSGAVYAKEMRDALVEGRIGQVPWERAVPVDVFLDLGRADHTSLWFAQRVAFQRRVLEAYQDTGHDASYFIKFIQRSDYTIGTIYLPHDGKAKTLGTLLSVEEQFRKHFPVRVMPKLGIADGINATRTMFPGLYFDEHKCVDGLQALRHYKYRVDSDGKFSREPLHDENSDFADALRTMALAQRPRREKSEMVETLRTAAEAAKEYLAGKGRSRSDWSGGSGGGIPPGQDWMGN